MSALDPLAFTSLGTLSLASGTYTIITDGGPGGVPVLQDGSSAVVFTGVNVGQSSSLDPSVGVLDFSDISIAAGVTILVAGGQPLALLSQGSVTIGGTIDASGGNGSDGVFRGAGGIGGIGGPGAAGGGAGGDYRGGGIGGSGPGAGVATGVYGLSQSTIGVGAGFGGLGGHPVEPLAGPTYGDLNLALEAGSGGGGSGSAWAGGGGGGGGGGAIEIGAVGDLTVGEAGVIRADGGSGGVTGDVFGYYGGAGSGGGIILAGATVTLTNTGPAHALVSAQGGSYNGGGGRILLLSADGTVNGTSDPHTLVEVNTGAPPYAQTGVVEIGVLAAACYAEGTRIATPRGQVPIEALRPGDTVLNAADAPMPVRWLGHRRVACARHPAPHDVWPVRVRAHAFGPGRPLRDLVLSPDHALLVADCLVPVRYLLNGATVAQERVDAVTYWHVELDRHDVVLAEGLPAETYLDTGNRAAFANGGPAVAMHPDFAHAVWDAQGCAPLVTSGPVVEAARRRLLERAARFGHVATADAAPMLVVDGVALPPARDGDWLRFDLPAGARCARLVSRTTCAADHFPTSDDRRRVGVALRALRIDGRDLPLDNPVLGAGFLPLERDGGQAWRWTDGDAALHVAGRRLELLLADWPRYWQAAARISRAR